ncbi:hypothetical protein FB471_2724 [Amycolatopsis cihanbeyliensis]|uniref:Uncharacterized protein n=2 Tax=Amycolatopsis cihanbeyliensis TaxID=1128664 RepID=A0A542DIZ3_AMYCI|nr:hypothetical protein FB471_2724 [Amycolatopsis cihanbeyliensis]
MTKEKGSSEESEESKGPGVKPLQVLAAGLAAVTAAFLGSSLGVYGTVLGAGVISVATTIGSELYLRSLHRTKEAARRSRVLAGGRSRQEKAVSAEGAPEGDDRTVPLPRPGQEEPGVEEGARTRLGRLRWPLIIATSVLAFVLGMLVLTGFELTTGKPVSGGEGSTIGRIVGGGGGQPAGGDQRGESPGGTDSGTAPPSGTGERPRPEDGEEGEHNTPDPTETPESTPSTPESSSPPTSSRSAEPGSGDGGDGGGGNGRSDEGSSGTGS